MFQCPFKRKHFVQQSQSKQRYPWPSHPFSPWSSPRTTWLPTNCRPLWFLPRYCSMHSRKSTRKQTCTDSTWPFPTHYQPIPSPLRPTSTMGTGGSWSTFLFKTLANSSGCGSITPCLPFSAINKLVKLQPQRNLIATNSGLSIDRISYVLNEEQLVDHCIQVEGKHLCNALAAFRNLQNDCLSHLWAQSPEAFEFCPVTLADATDLQPIRIGSAIYGFCPTKTQLVTECGSNVTTGSCDKFLHVSTPPGCEVKSANWQVSVPATLAYVETRSAIIPLPNMNFQIDVYIRLLNCYLSVQYLAETEKGFQKRMSAT